MLIEEIHPPAGAAAAYHAVQAAEINASASISDERGRAKRVAGVAQQEAHNSPAPRTPPPRSASTAANADAYRFDAERRAHAEGGQAFLLERSFSKIQAALAQKPLTLLDHRLSSTPGPIIDLRNLPGGRTRELPDRRRIRAPCRLRPSATGPARGAGRDPDLQDQD